MLIGGMRALLVQALNPLAMAAVADNSDYKTNGWGRLLRTTDYIMTTTYGDTQAAHRAAARVRAIHRRIKGIDEFTGLPYRADDPELLLWIHATEVHSFLIAYRTYGGRLSAEDADRYVKEMVRSAELVGLDADDVPATHGELRDYLRAQDIVVSPAAREAMRFVLVPPVPLPGGRVPAVPGGRLLIIPGRMAWSIPAAAAVAILPARARRLYGLPWARPATPAVRVAAFAFSRSLRVLLPPPPPVQKALERVRAAHGASAA